MRSGEESLASSAPVVEEEASSIFRRDGMLFHSEILSFSSSISFSRVLISLEIVINSS